MNEEVILSFDAWGVQLLIIIAVLNVCGDL